jgi:hypothetical protein
MFNMRCGLCHQEVDKLLKSHIVPEAMMLHGRPDGEDKPMLILPSDDGKHAKRSPTGIYSPIVCAKCEASFQHGDDELLRLLRTLAEGNPVANENGRALAKEYPHIDSSVLHRGILTTLFRAHLSPHEAFNRVDLGSHAEAVRQLVNGQGPTIGAGFDVVLRVIEGQVGTVTHSPFRERWNGVNAYRLYFPNITAYVKVDQRPFGELFDSVRLRPNVAPLAIIKETLSPSELRLLGNLVVKHGQALERVAR